MQARFRAKSLIASENGNPACENGFAGAITDQECQGPWQAAQYHHRQALLREASESQSRGATRLIAHKTGHNAFLANYEQSRASQPALIADSHRSKVAALYRWRSPASNAIR